MLNRYFLWHTEHMLKVIFNDFDSRRWSGLITALIVAVVSLHIMYSRDETWTIEFVLAGLLYAAYIVCYIFSTADEHGNTITMRQHTVWVVLQYCTAVSIYFFSPTAFSAILVGIWSGHIPYYTSLKKAMWLSPIWSLPLWLVHHFYWQNEYAWISALLFWTLNMAFLVMINANLKEAQARAESERMNRELTATQDLLNQATRQAERLRISRNIHDVVGHHLTALTINLQVAAHKTEGESKEQIQQCHAIAKLLLADVREAVSEIREKSSLELNSALHALLDSVPRMKINLECDENLVLDDVAKADAIVRCVQESLTNSLKHSGADTFNVVVTSSDDNIEVQIKDNGFGKSELKIGNGLTGMQERIKALGGTIAFNKTVNGFETHIAIPGAAA